jgi:hypothetical protein
MARASREELRAMTEQRMEFERQRGIDILPRPVASTISAVST